MSDNVIDLLILIGAIAYSTTVLVGTDGPSGIVKRFRNKINNTFGNNSPLHCFTCTIPYVTLIIAPLWVAGNPIINAIITLIGLMGLGLAVRGASGHF